MSNSYVLLEKIVVPAAGASSVTFSNIPQTGYTDLLLKISVRSDRASSTWDNSQLSINGSTANMSGRLLRGNGSTASSSTLTSFTIGDIPAVNATASTFASQEVYIPNYAGSTNKSASVDSVGENNATNAVNDLFANLWSQTTAINQLNVFSGNSANFVANSTFYLYGVAALGTTPTIAPKATGGDVIDTDGTYWYHTFRSSGTFTPATALSCDYLVVAGGGGGGNDAGANTYSGGGGGGGGYRTNSESLTSNTNYTVTVGAGGTGGASGTNGNNSVFSSITSTGGGRGGTGADGSAGGSGGGAGADVSVTKNGGAASPAGQGNAGGNATATQAGGGGGGATSAGSNGGVLNGGNGGAGTANSISGSSVTYAGGGGGGPRPTGSTGTHGGGNAANQGGGANGVSGTALSGNSGVVIVRYLVA